MLLSWLMRFLLTTLIVFMLSGCRGGDSSQASSADTEAARALWAESCERWDDWDKPGPAFQIYANTYYVGTCGISAILISGASGHILIDGGTAQGADLIAKNIAALGFDVSDIQILLHSHEHFDHVAGLAQLQRLSGARLYASVAAKPVLETGQSDMSDPQHGLHDPFPATRVDQIISDGESITLGDISLRAVATPGHTQGALSWQWKTCRGEDCHWVVYADSLSPISREGYRFSEKAEYLRAYKNGLERLRQIECTLLITPHPSASQMRRRLETGQLSMPRACMIYADLIETRLDKRLKNEAEEHKNLNK